MDDLRRFARAVLVRSGGSLSIFVVGKQSTNNYYRSVIAVNIGTACLDSHEDYYRVSG